MAINKPAIIQAVFPGHGQRGEKPAAARRLERGQHVKKITTTIRRKPKRC